MSSSVYDEWRQVWRYWNVNDLVTKLHDVVNTERQDSPGKVVLFNHCEFIYFRLLKLNPYIHFNPSTSAKQLSMLLIYHILYIVFKLVERAKKYRIKPAFLPVAQWNPITDHP